MRKFFLIALITAGTTLVSWGQTKILTFEEAIQIALKNGVLYNQEKNNLELSQMQKLASFAGAGPNVSLNAQAFQVNGNSFNQQAGSVINGVRDQINGSLNANMNLFSGFSRINTIRQFSNQLEAQSYFTNRTAQDLINTVANQYLTVMLDVELLKIAKENFEAQDKQLQQITQQLELGSRSQVDEYNQEALTKAAELRVVQAEITLENDKVTLAQTILIDPSEDFDVEKPNWDINAIGNDQLSIQELVQRAKESRGDYQRAIRQEQAQRFGMQAARGQSLPSLAAFFNYGSAYNFQHGVPRQIVDPDTGQLVDNTSYPRPFTEQFRTNNVFKSYGLQLTIPLFNGMQNRAAIAQQKVLYENSELNRKNIEYQISSDVIRSVRNFEGAKKSLAVTSDQLKFADLAFRFETERYNLGITNLVDYINANRAFVQAQTDRAQAEYRLIFQKILIEYAIGTLKPENLTD